MTTAARVSVSDTVDSRSKLSQKLAELHEFQLREQANIRKLQQEAGELDHLLYCSNSMFYFLPIPLNRPTLASFTDNSIDLCSLDNNVIDTFRTEYHLTPILEDFHEPSADFLFSADEYVFRAILISLLDFGTLKSL